jgi:hypothetical protein
MADRLIPIIGFTIMGVCLAFIAYQTVVMQRLLADVIALGARIP